MMLLQSKFGEREHSVSLDPLSLELCPRVHEKVRLYTATFKRRFKSLLLTCIFVLYFTSSF